MIELTKKQKVEEYGCGLRDGVAGEDYANKTEEYLRGHNDGVLFFREMMAKVRLRLKCPLTSEVMSRAGEQTPPASMSDPKR